MDILKKIGIFSILMILGCILLGYGLFLLWGLGVSLSVLGSISLLLGAFGAIVPIFLKGP